MTPGNHETYARQLRRLAHELALARATGVEDALSPDAHPLAVTMFLESNAGKRRLRLVQQLDFLSGGLDDLQELVGDYVCALPEGAYHQLTDDCAQFLEWLERQRELTPVERDYVACQRARHAVELQASADRRGHLRFQERWSVAGQLAGDLDSNAQLRIYLNPIRVWSRLETTALIDAEDTVPADVLVFAVRSDISTAMLDPPGLSLVRELEQLAPCTLDCWAGASALAERDELAELCRTLAEIGLVAFG